MGLGHKREKIDLLLQHKWWLFYWKKGTACTQYAYTEPPGYRTIRIKRVRFVQIRCKSVQAVKPNNVARFRTTIYDECDSVLFVAWEPQNNYSTVYFHMKTTFYVRKSLTRNSNEKKKTRTVIHNASMNSVHIMFAAVVETQIEKQNPKIEKKTRC